MNCLVSTLYVFWKTNPTNWGDYCYLLVYCSSFWHCSSDQGTVVLGTLHLQGEGQVLLGSILGRRRPGRQRVGRGKLSSGNACAVTWVARALGCAPWPPSQSRALSARPFSWDEESPWCPMLYLCHICWYALFTYALWCSRPSPALVSPALSSGCSHSRGYSFSWGRAARRWGRQRALCRGSSECRRGASKSPSSCVFNWSEPRCFRFSLSFVFKAQGQEPVWMSVRWEGGQVVLQEALQGPSS